jgi:hypothetical protein
MIDEKFKKLFKEAAKVSKSLSQSAAKGVAAISENKKLISTKSEAQSRLDICNKCKDLDKSLGRCTVCGCFVSLKTKADYESCPEGKW